LPFVVFISLWYAGKIVWLLVWDIHAALLSRDLLHPENASLASAGFAMLLSLVAFLRMIFGYADRSYMKTAMITSTCLLGLTLATKALIKLLLIDS
jgi:hypothetical protein